uniref:Uncharacterized protein n=1 Tax=Cacopsylla melanoneura TaxID=428564 RepID=A0A8D8Z3K1_9HEMI
MAQKPVSLTKCHSGKVTVLRLASMPLSMLQALQRRQQQEEMKIRKELEAQRRRDVEKRKADEKERKKQEMEAILLKQSQCFSENHKVAVSREMRGGLKNHY